MKVKSKKLKSKNGMTLFIAIVIMGILLFISFAVVNITVKSTLFASSGRDSQFAYYAADAGLECALYWDKLDKFATSTPGTITCASQTVSTGTQNPITGTSTSSIIGNNTTSRFGFVMNQGANPVNSCAIVTVTKNTDGSTYIKSRGYNTCDMNSPRRVERGIEINY